MTSSRAVCGAGVARFFENLDLGLSQKSFKPSVKLLLFNAFVTITMATTTDNSNNNDDDIPSRASTETDDVDDSLLAELGFMFESNQATTVQEFSWSTKKRRILVSLEHNDSEPGALQSGHYLWPAAKLLVDYIVDQYNTMVQDKELPSSIVELGAGCALASLSALQLYQNSLQCVIVTDHDPGTLERARGNYESTIEAGLNMSVNEDEMNQKINCLASIPVCFESLEWGKDEARMRNLIAEHTNAKCQRADLILGSDLIYCSEVVAPLLSTAAHLLANDGRFLLSQSFAYDDKTEQEIDQACETLHLKRKIILDQEEGEQRIQEFRPYICNPE
jgi:predicted nicotinamide N-methyase